MLPSTYHFLSHLRSGIAAVHSQGFLMYSDPATVEPAFVGDYSLRSGAAFAGKTFRLLKYFKNMRDGS